MKLRHRIGCFFIALVISTSATAEAASLPDSVTLPELFQLITERNPRLAAERLNIDIAEADKLTASALPNPSVSYGFSRPFSAAHTQFDGTRQQQVTMELPLLVSGQRAARLDTAAHAILASQARVNVLTNELAMQAADYHTGLLAAQEKLAVLQQSINEIDRIIAVVNGRLESGMASSYDLARVEVERAALITRLNLARTEQSNQAAGLAALVGAPGWQPAAAGTLQPANAAVPLAQWHDALAANNPQIIAARRDEDTARSAVIRAERERLPVPSLTVGRAWTNDPYGAVNFIGLTAELLLLDNRRGPVARAKAEWQSAQRQRESVEASANAELLRLANALSQQRAALDQFEQKIGSRIPALKQMADDAYRLGRGTILELIDATRARLDAQLTRVDLREIIVQQEINLAILTGRFEAQTH